jgi:dihydropyrimidinase
MNSILLILLLQLVFINCQNIQTIIINGLLVTGKEGLEPYLGHILIGKNGKILNVLRETGSELNEIKEKYKDAEIIDAKDNIVIPGGVDVGVKFEYLEGIHEIESSDNFFTGSVAAVCGGTTTILDIIEPNLNERETLSEALKSKLDEAEHNSVIDYSFHMVINYIKNDILSTEKLMKKSIYKNGINSFIFDTYTKKPKLSKDEMRIIFKLSLISQKGY